MPHASDSTPWPTVSEPDLKIGCMRGAEMRESPRSAVRVPREKWRARCSSMIKAWVLPCVHCVGIGSEENDSFGEEVTTLNWMFHVERRSDEEPTVPAHTVASWKEIASSRQISFCDVSRETLMCDFYSQHK